MLSLHVLVEPKHHSLQHEWVRAMRSLSPALRREISALSFLYRWTIPDCVLPAADTGYESFEDELGRLRRLRTDVVAFELLRPVYDHGGGARPARRRILGSAEVRAVAPRRAGSARPRRGARRRCCSTTLGASPSGSRRCSRRTGRKPSPPSGRARLEATLADGVQAWGRLIARDGLHAFLLSLAPQLRVDSGGRTFGLDLPHEHHVMLGPDNPLLLVPSAYVWPHVRVNCDAPWPLAVVYRAPHLVEGLRRSTPPELVRLLKALADPKRLGILELLAQQPRSTQELAPLVNLTDAGASKQLRTLAAAGLLTAKREGYYVVYSLETEKLTTLSAELAFLVGRPSSTGLRPGAPRGRPRRA